MTGTVFDLLQYKRHGVFAVVPNCTVGEAIGVMNEQNIGSVLVVDRAQLLGIFTERDVLTRVAVPGRSLDTPVVEVMTTRVFTVTNGTLIADAMRTMSSQRCRHLPVVEDGVVCNLVSAGDIMRHAIQCLELEVENLRSYVSTGAAVSFQY
jgi:signal-transduction protein with cAMP-binding, CBS, and nucleotidyltransferase domain